MSTLQYKGVNLSGLEFGSGIGTVNTTYVMPPQSHYAYWAQKVDSNIVRLPFMWERLQPQLGGQLDQNYLSYLKQSVNYAKANGMTIILDLHNYGRYNGQVVNASQLTDVWTKLGQAFKGDTSVWFDLMNEPYNISATQWAGVTQQTVNALRASGIDNKLLLEGTAWSGAHSWINSGNAAAFANFKDPANNYAFDVHQYLDSDSSGTSATAVPGSGSTRLVAVTNWAESTGQKLFLGEAGLADNTGSETEMKAMINYMEAHSDVWLGFTLWGAGPWWPQNYIYSINPTGIGTSNVTNDPSIQHLLSLLAPAGDTTPIPTPNQPPVAQADDIYGQQYRTTTGNVLANNGHGADSDPSGQTLSVVAAQLTTAKGGAVVLNSNGTFTYTPASGFYGADTFTYTLKDSGGLTATGTVNVNVNAAPVAHPDDFTGKQNVAISGNVLADNGHGADHDPDTAATLSVTPATITTAHGQVNLSANGSFTYTPASGYSGADSFKYTLLDERGGQAEGTASITVQPVNTTPMPTYTVYGGVHDDRLVADKKTGTTIYGMAGDDNIIGRDGNDILDGGTGNDKLQGNAGDDVLIGGAGDDRLQGGAGNDVLDGGPGKDRLTGGLGNDVFKIGSTLDGADIITDFHQVAGDSDKLDLTVLFAANGLGNVGAASAVQQGFLVMTQKGGNLNIAFDADGAASAARTPVSIAVLNGVDKTHLDLTSIITMS